MVEYPAYTKRMFGSESLRRASSSGLSMRTRDSIRIGLHDETVQLRGGGRTAPSKYVTWGEIEGLWAAGCSVLIYQHFRREPRQALAERLAEELRSRTGGRFLEAFRTPHVLFLLAAQDRHAQRFGDAIALLSDRWNGQIRPMGLANKPLQPTGFAGG
jgi:hypothetical protein